MIGAFGMRDAVAGNGGVENASGKVGKAKAEQAGAKQRQERSAEAPAVRAKVAKEIDYLEQGFPVDFCLGEFDSRPVVP